MALDGSNATAWDGVTYSIPLPDDLFDVLRECVRAIVREELERALEVRSAWLDVAGAAEYAAMSPEAIRSATKRGQLRVHRGETGRLRYRTEDLDDFLSGDAK